MLLRILAREASGYHAVETLFQKLALHDVVTVRATNATRTLSCNGPCMPPGGLGAPESNLAWRAADAYVAAGGWPTGWEIAIEKHIPVGGGLGGGSADAAAVLRALEQLSPRPVGRAALLEIGGSLGADVAFFVSEASLALAWGRGDRLLELSPLPATPVALFAFDMGVNTAQAYGALARERERVREQLATSGEGATAGAVRAVSYASDAFATWRSVCALAANDFELVVPAMHAGVGALLPIVKHEAQRATAPCIGLLSGSGATCFALGEGATDMAIDEALLREAGARRISTSTA
jgi:4-diphosphocytidyl-2-C-methyl-D-erythritol kinase